MIIDIRKKFKRMRKSSTLSTEEIEKQMQRVVAYLSLEKKANEIKKKKK